MQRARGVELATEQGESRYRNLKPEVDGEGVSQDLPLLGGQYAY